MTKNGGALGTSRKPARNRWFSEYICLITGISQSSNAPCRLNASEGRCCWAWSVKFLDKV